MQWCHLWSLPLNATKTVLIRVSRKRAENISQFTYTVEGIPVAAANNTSYLGVSLDTRWDWSGHIANKVLKAHQMLSLINRNFYHSSPETKIALYHAIVKPHLYYAAACWDPFTDQNVTKLEAVQRRAARVIHSDWSRDSSVSDLLRNLGWHPLADERLTQKLVLFYNIYHGNTILDRSQFLACPDHCAPRIDHIHKVKLYQPTHDYFRHSFFPDTIMHWNALPAEAVSSESTSQFKNVISNLRTKPPQCV